MTKIVLTGPLNSKTNKLGVVGCGKDVMYLTSQGCPTDIGLQLVKTCFLVAGKGRGECFYFFRFFTFIPFPLSSLPLSFVSSTIVSFSFLLFFSGRRHKMTHKCSHFG